MLGELLKRPEDWRLSREQDKILSYMIPDDARRRL